MGEGQRQSFPGSAPLGTDVGQHDDKLLLAERLPADLQRVIWLDCDLVVLADAGRLWDENLNGHHALATKDAVVPLVSSPSGVAGWKELGIPADASYFNAGVMSIDLTLWRRDRCGRSRPGVRATPS